MCYIIIPGIAGWRCICSLGSLHCLLGYYLDDIYNALCSSLSDFILITQIWIELAREAR